MSIQNIRGTAILSIALVLMVAASYAEGNQEREERSGDYGRFTSLSVEVPGEVTLLRGDTHRVEAEIPRAWRDVIVIRNERGTLVIEERRNRIFNLTAQRPRFVITMPTIEEVSLSSSGELRSEDRWEGDRVEISLSGSGRMRLAAIAANELEATISGSGTLGIGEMNASEVRVRSSGSGELTAGQIRAGEMELRSSGSGGIRASLEADSLDASSSGSADLVLDGRVEQLRVGTSGSGSFRGEELYAGSVEVRMSGSGNVTLQEGSGVTNIRSSGSGDFSLR